MVKKILITGASGYIGSSFINQYSKYQFERFSFLNQKLKDINFEHIDTILHCAALVHQKVEYPYKKYHEINVNYPVKLAKLAKKNGVKQFVFISSIAVYGEDKEKLDENTSCNPTTPYGKSKLEAEQELLKLTDEIFIVSIIRPPMVYGKDAPGNIDSLMKFVKKIPIIPLGGIENKRSFVSIENLCYIINEVITQQKEGIFLASDDKPLSTSRLIELIAKNLNLVKRNGCEAITLCEKKVYLIKIPFFETFLKLLKPSFHKRLYGSLEVDNTITKQKLNLRNPYSVEEGIQLMINGEMI
jgi:UDP-glucose 4-epimerase